MKRERGDKRLEHGELAVGKASKGRGRKVMISGRVRRGTNQFLGAMNQFYKYDKRGLGAYNLAHPKPAVGTQHCLTSDEHSEVSTVVRELL
jgi:hypothetical protein